MSVKAATPKEKQIDSSVQHQRGEDFTQHYANNTLFEPSNWDLKIIFGQTDASLGVNAVVQHTGIAVPWAQAKLMIYFITLNLLIHEGNAGRVSVPKGLIPVVPEEMPKLFRDQGTSAETWKAMRRLYLDFVASNPEAATK
jgi:hypothetical protein